MNVTTFAALDAERPQLVDLIPAGYELTEGAKIRIAALAGARNRSERRALSAEYRRKPIKTFQKKTS